MILVFLKTILTHQICNLPLLKTLDASQNRLTRILAPFRNPRLENINLAKNQISDLTEETFTYLDNLKSMDLRENLLKVFHSFPKSQKLETVLLSYNHISEMTGFSYSPNIVTFDLKNNKLKEVSDEIFVLKSMKILDLSNNDLQNLPPELGLLKNLGKLQVEGNPLKSIRLAVRQGGTEAIKQYLLTRIDPNNIPDSTNDPKYSLVKSEMQEKPSNVSKLVLLIRQMKNTNGDLDLRGKGLTWSDITEDIIKADKVKTLDLSQNKLDRFPDHVDKLNPTSIKLNQNNIKTISTQEILNFTTLKDIEIQSNRMQSFCDGILMKEDILLVQMNFACLTYLDLSQNNLTSISPIIREFKNLRSLNLSFNSITTLEDLFVSGSVPMMDHFDMSNNSLTEVPTQVYKWQTLTSFVLQNNNIRNFPPELGFLNLKNLNISGNPTLLLKGANSNRGMGGLLNYLKERATNRVELEKEVTLIREKPHSTNLPPKKPSDLVEYEFPDPFKQKINDYNVKQDQKYGEVYEDDFKKQLQEQKSKKFTQQYEPSSFMNKPQAQNVNHARGQHKFYHEEGKNMSELFSTGGDSVSDLEDKRTQLKASGINNSQKMKRDEFEELVYNTEKKAPQRSNPFQTENQPQISNPKLDEEPKPKNTSNDEGKKELDAKIKFLQDKIDNDYTLSKVKIAEARKELNQLRIQRNQMN